MITPSQAKQIKKKLGAHYTSLVQEELKKMSALNKHGKIHSANQIRVVLSGHRSNQIIETAIYNAVETKNAELKKRKELLKTNP